MEHELNMFLHVRVIVEPCRKSFEENNKHGAQNEYLQKHEIQTRHNH